MKGYEEIKLRIENNRMRRIIEKAGDAIIISNIKGIQDRKINAERMARVIKHTKGAIKNEKELIDRLHALEDGSIFTKVIMGVKTIAFIGLGVMAIYYINYLGLIKKLTRCGKKKQEGGREKQDTDRGSDRRERTKSHSTEAIYEQTNEQDTDEIYI